MLKKLLLGLIGLSIAFSAHAQVINTKSDLYDFLSMRARNAGFDIFERKGNIFIQASNDIGFMITGLSENPNQLNFAAVKRNCTVSQKMEQMALSVDIVVDGSGGNCAYGDLRSFYLPITEENYIKHFDNFMYRLGEINRK